MGVEELDQLHETAIAEDGIRSIILEELSKAGMTCEVHVDIPLNFKRVGVQGDARTYGHNAMLGIYQYGKPFYEPGLMARISNRITNEIPREPILVNGVTLELAKRKD